MYPMLRSSDTEGEKAMKRIWFFMVMLFGMVVLWSPVCWAELWVEIPGYVVFEGDDGAVKSRSFSSWLTMKDDPKYAWKKDSVTLGGFFSFKEGTENAVMHVFDAARYDMDGRNTPITITYRDGQQREVRVNNSFVYAISRLHFFRFMGEDPVTRKTVQYEIPAESVRTMVFYPPEK